MTPTTSPRPVALFEAARRWFVSRDILAGLVRCAPLATGRIKRKGRHCGAVRCTFIAGRDEATRRCWEKSFTDTGSTRALSADKGGFGDVYFATHVDSGAEAVVKVLKPEMSALRDIVARFFNEARAAASVHHPGIVQIHNVGYHGDRAYLLMERLRGDDLETRLAAGPLPVDRAVVFLRQTAGAIGAAHERGIVHRDLKPANLFVVAGPGRRRRRAREGARLRDREADRGDAGAGKTQGVFGTPAYMSPEQCASTGAVDGARGSVLARLHLLRAGVRPSAVRTRWHRADRCAPARRAAAAARDRAVAAAGDRAGDPAAAREAARPAVRVVQRR